LAARFEDLAQPVTSEAADGPQRTVRSKRSAAEGPGEEGILPGGGAQHAPEQPAGWDATHRRVTYWMHVDVISGVRQAAQRNGESVASFVSRALREELQRTRPPHPLGARAVKSSGKKGRGPLWGDLFWLSGALDSPGSYRPGQW
jgi:hypothetical protein